jgi:hypothetical protein
MAEQVEKLVAAFEKSNAEFIAFVEGLTDAQWHALVPGEERTVGVVVHHVAESHNGTIGATAELANGQALPFTQEMIDQGAVEHKKAHANVTKAEALATLRANGATGAGILRTLRDEQLDNSGAVALMGGQQTKAGQFAEFVVLGHIAGHTANIKAALGI